MRIKLRCFFGSRRLAPSLTGLGSMPEIVADSVDAFVFRHSGSRVQFLLLQRETGRSFAGVWQSMHARIEQRETTLAAARRSVRESIGVDPLSAYSVDYIGQIFDHERDLIVAIAIDRVRVASRR